MQAAPSVANEIADTQQQIHRAKAVGHEHLRVWDFCMEAVSQNHDLTNIGRRAEKICNLQR